MMKKVVLVTGASSGIGLSIANYLHFQKKYIVYGTSRKTNNSSDFSFNLIDLDVTNKSSIQRCISEILKKESKIDILINNAGITRDSLVLRMKNHQWDEVLNTNLKGAFYATKSVLRSMMKNKYGRIINITSIVGLQGNSGQSNYSASKAGLIGFSQSVAKEVASRGITINCIAPGWIETEMTNDLPQDIKSEIIKNIPIGKTGTTEDIAYTALFLASKESKYITGQTITVDGGRVIN